jgi:putative addiction module killer protein
MYRIRKYRCANGRIPFDEWFNAIKDLRVKARLLKRLDKVQLGNLGDWNSVSDGVFELREHFNKGFRIYYGMEKRTVILLLCGGDKSTQAKDIKKAKQYWQEFKEG